MEKCSEKSDPYNFRNMFKHIMGEPSFCVDHTIEGQLPGADITDIYIGALKGLQC
jgi:hypothetical protein